MTHTVKTVTVFGVLLSLLLLSACGGQEPTSTPTPDLNPLRTEVAATVFAQVNRDLALTPSATVILCPPTATLTFTPTPTQIANVSPSPKPTSTGGTPGVSTTDQAAWVSQSIADGTIFAPGETFTITWRLRNVGTSTWTAGYLLRFYSGNTFGAPQEIPIGQVVPPNGTVDISISMKAPTTPGDYRSDWVLSNESRSNFKEPVFLKIAVPAPSTATPTPTRTSTPTLTPTSTPTSTSAP